MRKSAFFLWMGIGTVLSITARSEPPGLPAADSRYLTKLLSTQGSDSKDLGAAISEALCSFAASSELGDAARWLARNLDGFGVAGTGTVGKVFQASIEATFFRGDRSDKEIQAQLSDLSAVAARVVKRAYDRPLIVSVV